MAAMRIGEAARRTGLSPRTLRHHERLGLLAASRRSSGDDRLDPHVDHERLTGSERPAPRQARHGGAGEALDESMDIGHA